MFSIIITEKGGSERRETYDRAEINVGRVQGNDLMLPKGNVSKRHARLLFRDGRFIVTDLKSTNGTYVNGRKIAQATIVREGDKIYIGDFVLRIEMQAGAGASSHEQPIGSQPEGSDASIDAGRLPSMPSIEPGAASARLSSPGVSIPAPPAVPDAAASLAAMSPAPSALPPSSGAGGPGAPGSGPSIAAGPAGPASTGLPSVAAPAGGPPSGLVHGAQSAPGLAPGGAAISAAAPSSGAGPGSGADGVSYFPLDRDPDEGAGYGSVPSPPRIPGAGGSLGGPGSTAAPAPVRTSPPLARPAPGPIQATQLGTGGPGPVAPALAAPPADAVTAVPGRTEAAPPPVPPAFVSPVGGPVAGGLGGGPTASPSLPSAVPPPNAAAFPPVPPSAQRRPPSSEDRPADAARTSGRRQLVAALVERAGAAVDLRPLASGEAPPPPVVASIERALKDAAAALAPGAPPGVDVEVAIGDARRELLELGPIGPLLDDEDLSEVQIIRHDHVVATSGRRSITSEVAFSSEASLERVLARLCARSGRPLDPAETFVDRRLDNLRLFAVLGRRDGAGSMVTLRRPHRADQTLDDLVRAGAVSRVVASFLGQAVTARANVLVTGGHGAGATTLLGALAAAGSTEDRVVVLQEDDEIVFNQPHTVSILLGDTAEQGARAVRAALRAHPDRLVIGAFAGHVVAEVVDAVGDGIEGVMAAARAPTLRHLASRLPADIAATRGGLALDVAREWLASSFDLVVEVAKLRDGRIRVLRVAELVHEVGPQGGQLLVKDVFTFTVERIAAGGAVEGSFVATGHVPRLAEDLAQRGAPVDPALFKPTSKAGSQR